MDFHFLILYKAACLKSPFQLKFMKIPPSTIS